VDSGKRVREIKHETMIAAEIMSKIQPGARVKVFSTGESTFEGLIIARKHGTEAGATFTVRSIVAGVGVEKVFPIHSPVITKVIVVSVPKKVHRSKLYSIRKMSGSRIRQKLGVSL
jgi:ribosomal protein L19